MSEQSPAYEQKFLELTSSSTQLSRLSSARSFRPLPCAGLDWTGSDGGGHARPDPHDITLASPPLIIPLGTEMSKLTSLSVHICYTYWEHECIPSAARPRPWASTTSSAQPDASCAGARRPKPRPRASPGGVSHPMVGALRDDGALSRYDDPAAAPACRALTRRRNRAGSLAATAALRGNTQRSTAPAARSPSFSTASA